MCKTDVEFWAGVEFSLNINQNVVLLKESNDNATLSINEFYLMICTNF